MDNFPEFMKHPANRIARSHQATAGVEGYVFDGEDGSQMAFWTCSNTTESAAHTHDCDEYMIVVQGCYTLIINGERIPLMAGEEFFMVAEWRTAERYLLERNLSTHLTATGPSASKIRKASAAYHHPHGPSSKTGFR